MPSPIILVTAAGPNVGAAVSKKFADNGYKVTLAARSLSERFNQMDISMLKQIYPVPTLPLRSFIRLRKPWYPEYCWLQWSCVPSNLSDSSLSNYPRCSSPCYLPDDSISASLKIPRESGNVSLGGAYIAAQEALRGFKELPKLFPNRFHLHRKLPKSDCYPGGAVFCVAKSGRFNADRVWR
jgi:hypothetical protein